MNAPQTSDSVGAQKLQTFRAWDGSDYYGRAQLKSWPFEPEVVGGYIFLAGLSGSAQVLSTIADATGDWRLRGVVRHGRYLALLAPTLGPALLIYDLHTPKRFYNMLRVAKATSPMSIGTWLLMSFSAGSFLAAAAQAGSDRWPRQAWMRGLASTASVPAAIAGVGLSTYTAALLSATSTPLWAAQPGALAVRFGSSSVAAGAAALSLLATDAAVRRKLDAVQASALVVEAFAALASSGAEGRIGMGETSGGAIERVESHGPTVLGVMLPLGLLTASALLARPRGLSRGAGIATLIGSVALRSTVLRRGNQSAARPDVSFRFSTPDRLPQRRM